jgi:hypothetical protein
LIKNIIQECDCPFFCGKGQANGLRFSRREASAASEAVG